MSHLNHSDKSKYNNPITPKINFDSLGAYEEASRCLMCHDSPCNKGCPAGVNPAKFIRSIRFKNIVGAAVTIRNANIFASICAHVCPVERLCEGNCNRHKIDYPIQISKLQQFVTEYEKKINIRLIHKAQPKKEKIAVIGAGIIGLVAAARLATTGYQVHVFEKSASAGGFLNYGYLPEQLPPEVLAYDIQCIEKLGVQITLNCEIGKDKSFKALQEEGYDAYLYAGNDDLYSLDKQHQNHIWSSASFLYAYARRQFSTKKYENVVIYGDDNLALNSAIATRLLNAKHVTIISPNKFGSMLSDSRHIRDALSLDINIINAFTLERVDQVDPNFTFISARSTESSVGLINLPADLLIISKSAPEGEHYLNELCTDSTEPPYALEIASETTDSKFPPLFASHDLHCYKKSVVESVAKGKSIALRIDHYLKSQAKQTG